MGNKVLNKRKPSRRRQLKRLQMNMQEAKRRKLNNTSDQKNLQPTNVVVHRYELWCKKKKTEDNDNVNNPNVSAGPMEKEPLPGMTELDKFKRRMIRSVARLLLQEKRPEEEVWATLRKETGCDCKLLWERMRALTMKKLKRLLEADDRPEAIAPVARMSLTDWLLFDLVLVHEKIDVIGREKQTQLKVEHRPLVHLFSLVQRFNINSLSGAKLAEAWSAATIHYNREGHQCSPMLLQRRWHQLKELTRTNFYSLWQTYRGNDRLWDNAQNFKPTPLQLAIANCFPALITHPFPEWEELIQKRLVILPQEFEEKMRQKDLPEPCDENDPDLVLVEPVIESIDLGADSDSDHQTDTSPNSQSHERTTNPVLNNEHRTETTVNLAAVKKEPVDEVDGLSNVKILEATHIPSEVLNTEDIDTNSKIDGKMKTELDFIDPKEERQTSTETEQCVEVTAVNAHKHISGTTPVEDDLEDLNPIIKGKVDKYLATKEEKEQEVVQLDSDYELGNKSNEDWQKVSVKDTNEESNDSVVDDIIKQRAEEFIKKSDVKNPDTLELDIPSDLNFVDEGIEFVDDGIEYVDEDEDISDVLIKIDPEIKEERRESEDTAKFDLKLLMEPVVYTTKLDTMRAFKCNEFHYVDNKEVIEQIVTESKPVSERSINVQHNISEAHKESESKTDTTEQSEEEYESEEEISEDQRVKETSYLVQKPRSRSYNPIQLCKNPDFNTRLKRLTAGFFCSPRNVLLLKACKPMTIDVHKAFETKLINGTLYLKTGGSAPEPPKVDDQSKQTVSVVPSAMPVQSLLDNIIQNHFKSEEIAERNKVINLRDLSEIRKINQRLLTAEVPPLRVETASNDTQPVSAQANAAVIENKEIFTDNSLLTPRIPQLEEYASDNPKPIPTSQCKEDNKYVKNLLETLFDPGPKKKRYVWQKPRVTDVPWTKFKPRSAADTNDFLITSDTLNKMIQKINGTNLAAQAKIKKAMDKKRSGEGMSRQTNPAQAGNDQEKVKQRRQRFPRKPRQRKAPGTKTAKDPNSKKTVVLSDEENDEKLKNAVESIERVVQKSDVPKPVVKLLYNNSVVDDASTNLAQDSANIDTASVHLQNSEKSPVPTVELSTDAELDSGHTNRTYCRGLPLNVDNVTASKSLLNTVPVVTPEELTEPVPQIRVRVHAAQPQFNVISTQTQAVQSHLNQTMPPVPLKKATVWPFTKQKQYSPKHIVIDGSKPCSIPKTVVEDNYANAKQMVLLNPKNIAMKATESPIYLGKDKILLTTVKLPKHLTDSPNIMVDYPPKVIPTLPLPEGVSLVLMPNGELTYNVEPGIELGDAQLAVLPAIMAAVQQQINSNKSQQMNATTPSTSQDDIIKLSDDETSPSEVIDKSSENDNPTKNSTNEVNKATNVDTPTEKKDNLPINTSDSAGSANVEQENQKETGENQMPPVTASNSEKVLNNSDTALVDNVAQELPEKNSDPNQNQAVDSVESNSGSRNLLSDLMEMSGISAEDTVPAEVPNVIQEVSVPSMTLTNNVSAANMFQPAHAMTSSELVNLPELTPITSLNELKYACQHNGKFFKLDFITGIVVPINVCIKKSTKPIGKGFLKTFSAPESVIDLTDDVEYSFETAASPSPSKDASPSKDNSQLSPQKMISDQSKVVKPVKLFKASSATPIILNNQFQRQVIYRKVAKCNPKKRMRKQSLKNLSSKIEAKIDLVDSDAPMEEEYLMESSDSGDETLDKHKSSTGNITTKNSGDTENVNLHNRANVFPEELFTSHFGSEDSDDEPLAKKSKRIRVHDTGKGESDKGGEVSPDLSKDQESSENRGSCLESSSTAYPIEVSETHSELDMATEPKGVAEIDFMEGVMDEDESQEDCILGF